MAEKAFSLPFAIDAYGKVAQTQDQTKIWSDRVRSVIGTTLRERVMRPAFGTIIPYALFENEDNAKAEIEIEVNQAFLEQLPLLRLSTVNATSDQYSNTLSVEIVYELPNNEVVSTVVGLVLIQGAKPIYQELL